MTTIVNIRKSELKTQGYASFEEWNAEPDTLYIGRNMTFYIPGTTKSKWCNPYAAKKYGLDKCLVMYEEYVRNSSLYDDLLELDGKILGCFCHPNKCHGDVLIKLLKEKKKKSK